MTISTKKNWLIWMATLACVLLLTAGCQPGYRGQSGQTFVIGCANNTAGMLMNYAVVHSGSEGLSAYRTESFTSYLLMDCCSSKTAWSLSSGELDAAVLCPDAARSFVEENPEYRVAAELTYGSEALVYKEESSSFERIGYMSGQERQRQAVESMYPQSRTMPVMMSSLAYALHVDEVDAAVLDITTAALLDYPYILLSGEKPTAVLVTSESFYRSEEYAALLLSWENAKAAIGEYEPFCEAMSFLFSEKPGRKEYEKWLVIADKQFQASGQPETPK